MEIEFVSSEDEAEQSSRGNSLAVLVLASPPTFDKIMTAGFYKIVLCVLGTWSLLLVPSVLAYPSFWGYVLASSYLLLFLAALIRILNIGSIFPLLATSLSLVLLCGILRSGLLYAFSLAALHIIILGVTVIYEHSKTSNKGIDSTP